MDLCCWLIPNESSISLQKFWKRLQSNAARSELSLSLSFTLGADELESNESFVKCKCNFTPIRSPDSALNRAVARCSRNRATLLRDFIKIGFVFNWKNHRPGSYLNPPETKRGWRCNATESRNITVDSARGLIGSKLLLLNHNLGGARKARCCQSHAPKSPVESRFLHILGLQKFFLFKKLFLDNLK